MLRFGPNKMGGNEFKLGEENDKIMDGCEKSIYSDRFDTPMTPVAYKLKISAQCALVGNVTANLAAVTVRLDGQTILVSSYFFNAASEEDIENMRCVGTEIISDYPDYLIDEAFNNIHELDMSNMSDCVFLRSEVLAKDRGSMGSK